MPDLLSDNAKVRATARRVDDGSTPRIGGDLQREALALVRALGVSGEALAHYCEVSRSAVCRWCAGQREMPADALARTIALLPWLSVHNSFQAAVARDRAGAATPAALEPRIDALVRRALDDPRLAAAVEHAWADIYAALDSEAGRAALARITAAHLLRKPVGCA
jgi:hypothetical protein